MSADLVTRVVKGPNNFNHIDPETKERVSIAPGEEVQVSKAAARAFADVLIDPQVLAAQQQAAEVTAEAEEELQEDNEEKEPAPTTASTSKPEAPKSPQRSTGPLKSARPGTGKSSTSTS